MTPTTQKLTKSSVETEAVEAPIDAPPDPAVPRATTTIEDVLRLEPKGKETPEGTRAGDRRTDLESDSDLGNDNDSPEE